MGENKPQITAVFNLLLLQAFFISISCSIIKQADIDQGQSMFTSVNTSNLFILSRNSIYRLNSNTLDEEEKLDQTNSLVVHKDQGTEAVITCGTDEQCYVRNISGIKNIKEKFRISENKGNTTGVFVTFNKTNYLFYGIPDYEEQQQNKGGGLYKNNTKLVRFKSDSVSVTERFVAAFSWKHLVWFFSIKKERGRSYTKITQIHNKYELDPTRHSYIDMNITCGVFDELIDVKKEENDENVAILVATFGRSGSVGSAVCVFTSEQIVERFIDNYVECAKGNKFPHMYIDTVANTCQRRTGWNYTRENFRKFDYDTNQLGKNIFYVIGVLQLSPEPAVKILSHTVTALTLTKVDTGIMAFLGTSHGQIFKVPIYSESSKVHIPIWKDQFKQKIVALESARNGDSIFALTSSRVVKIPTQECDKYKNCDKCLSQRDPYCGWCMFQHKCGIKASCSSVWVQDVCPRVLSVQPDTMLNKQTTQTFRLTLSHELNNESLECVFKNTNLNLEYKKKAIILENRTEVECQLALDPAYEIKRSEVVKILLYEQMAERSVLEGSMNLYTCAVLSKCSTCIEKRYNCHWCNYDNRCVYKNDDCETRGPDANATIADQCMMIDSFEIQHENILDENRTVYFSTGGTYNVQITLRNSLQTDGNLNYTCRINENKFHAELLNDTTVECTISKVKTTRRLKTDLQLHWGDYPLEGAKKAAVLYNCSTIVQRSNLCKCASFKHYQPYYQCHVCYEQCQDAMKTCIGNQDCGNPSITKVFPVSAHVNATTIIDINGTNLGSRWNDTQWSVKIAGFPCESIESLYIPSERISCKLIGNNTIKSGDITVQIGNKPRVIYSGGKFSFRVPEAQKIVPTLGPMAGGTDVTILGRDLYTGRPEQIDVLIDGRTCRNVFVNVTGNITCRTQSSTEARKTSVEVRYNGSTVEVVNIEYEYVIDPVVTKISPNVSFKCGGRHLTVTGDRLHAIQTPKIFAVFSDLGTSKSHECEYKNVTEKPHLLCYSPKFDVNSNTRDHTNSMRSAEPSYAQLNFVMDDVASVRNLEPSIAKLTYFEDPSIERFKGDLDFHPIMTIMGADLDKAATIEEIQVLIGKKHFKRCNITTFESSRIIFNPPEEPPVLSDQSNNKYLVTVVIGYLEKKVGYLVYPSNDKDYISYIIAGVVLLVLVAVIAISVVALIKVRRRMKTQKTQMAVKMDKLEGAFRTQCREEFAALQTAVSDLTCDLEGGKVLFRDYSVYTRKIVFPVDKTSPIVTPAAGLSQSSMQAMETFKGLLRNTQFLLMLIRTLEKQSSFTIQNRSTVATILMMVNHDNMEFLTSILKTLLNDLVDKNIASQTPKLMLRRSECVVEKLLTHWLSVCLYQDLQERSGSALYILYKAIKIQVEKGPVDYITGCAKYTLSEDKLFTVGDNNTTNTLVLEVDHLDIMENQDKHISVSVLECDTITQVKNKMLEILYKNTPYSQRPLVHGTILELQEEDGTKRFLNDEDPMSVKEGLWKKINTMQHYNIKNGMKFKLLNSKELDSSIVYMKDVSPDSFFVGSLQRTKSVVRTISGSNFWHMTKQNQNGDEVKLSSDLCLPRLLTTKGTLQKYVDDLFNNILVVGDTPPLIIKYLYDFLDSMAASRGITDPDVLHTWKCNSLLLRFWVNIIKNPDFVFDIYKPNLVDSCLSVVAQTFMDSCSTADLVLGPHSPSNKLLYAKDIPRYKEMVAKYFSDIKSKPAVSDQEFNSFLTQNVSEKFMCDFNKTGALVEMFKYVRKHKDEISKAMDNLEAESPGSFSPLASKLEYILMSMD